MRIEQAQWAAGAPVPPGVAGRLGASAQLVLLFGGSATTVSRHFEAVRRLYPHAHLFGCSTAGEIQGVHVRDQSVALTAVAFAHTRLTSVRVRVDGSAGSFEAGRQLARRLDPRGLRHAFVLSEGLHVSGGELVRGLYSELPPGVSASGGFAGAGVEPRATHVWCNEPTEQVSAIALGFYGERLKVGVSATNGRAAGQGESDLDQLIDGAVTAARASVDRLGSARQAFSILVSCNGRRAALKHRIGEEVAAVRGVMGVRTALTGFYASGDIAPTAAAATQRHGEALTITSFAER